MAEIRITYNSESIKNISELNGMKGKNLVANEIYANEDWLDADQDGDNAFDHEISGVEFLNFAKHIDTNGDEKITDVEIENWRSGNKGVGNSAHKSFSDEEVVELFGMVIDQANAESGRDDAGYIYTTSDNTRNTVNFDSDPSLSNRISLTGRKTDALLESFDNSRLMSSGNNSGNYTLKIDSSRTIDTSRATDTADTKEEVLEYDTSELSSKSTNTVNSTMKQLKATNLVAQNIYAHEEWLDENENDGKATNKNVDGKISGEELASFAKHVDQNNDGKITYSEFDQWRTNNIDVGNSAHANFTYEQALEVFNSVKDK